MEDLLYCAATEKSSYTRTSRMKKYFCAREDFFKLLWIRLLYLANTRWHVSHCWDYRQCIVNFFLMPVTFRKLYVLNHFLFSSKQDGFKLQSLKAAHTHPLFYFLRSTDTQYCQSNSQKCQAHNLFKTYFEMGTTSSMSKPTRGLWFNCFTKPLSTTYLKKIHALSEKKTTEVSVDRQETATCISSKQEHIYPRIANR